MLMSLVSRQEDTNIILQLMVSKWRNTQKSSEFLQPNIYTKCDVDTISDLKWDSFPTFIPEIKTARSSPFFWHLQVKASEENYAKLLREKPQDTFKVTRVKMYYKTPYLGFYFFFD